MSVNKKKACAIVIALAVVLLANYGIGVLVGVRLF